MLAQLKKSIKAFLHDYNQIRNWRNNHKQGHTPHLIKQKHIKYYQKKYQLYTLVETGTYMGDMVYAMRKRFKQIYSIELSPRLFQLAVERFAPFNHISIMEGDSGIVLQKLMPEISKPTLFWLDGHYSGGATAKGILECPIFEELNAILKSTHIESFVVLIDDARLFVGTNDYPTLMELKSFLETKKKVHSFKVVDDIIHINFIKSDKVS